MRLSSQDILSSRVQDRDIYFSTAPITFARAALLGGDVRIKTVDGEVTYTVKPGTQTNTQGYALETKVFHRSETSRCVVASYPTLVVEVPTKMNSEQKELLEAFDKAMYGEKNEDETPSDEKKHGKKGMFGKKRNKNIMK